MFPLKAPKRATQMTECHLSVRQQLPGALDLVQSAHRLCDRRGKLDERRRHRGIGLESIEAASEGFARILGHRDGIVHRAPRMFGERKDDPKPSRTGMETTMVRLVRLGPVRE